MRKAAVLLSVVSLAACSPQLHEARFQSFPARPDDAEVKIYQTVKPSCKYAEVGTITATRPSTFIKDQRLIDEMKVRARRMGGDALVGLTRGQTASDATVVGSNVSIESQPQFTATVIRFTDDSCRE
jgi:hypothetical protein